jgi:hypothetical protein
MDSFQGVVLLGWGGYKEKMKEGEYGRNIMGSCMKNEK